MGDDIYVVAMGSLYNLTAGCEWVGYLEAPETDGTQVVTDEDGREMGCYLPEEDVYVGGGAVSQAVDSDYFISYAHNCEDVLQSIGDRALLIGEVCMEECAPREVLTTLEYDIRSDEQIGACAMPCIEEESANEVSLMRYFVGTNRENGESSEVVAAREATPERRGVSIPQNLRGQILTVDGERFVVFYARVGQDEDERTVELGVLRVPSNATILENSGYYVLTYNGQRVGLINDSLVSAFMVDRDQNNQLVIRRIPIDEPRRVAHFRPGDVETDSENLRFNPANLNQEDLSFIARGGVERAGAAERAIGSARNTIDGVSREVDRLGETIYNGVDDIQ